MPSSSASAHAQAAREGFRARKSLGVTTLAVPESTDAEYTLAENGTFVEGDLSVTAHGLVINNAGESDRAGAQLAATEAAAAASRSVGQGAFATLNLDALSVQGTIGAGSSGVVQRVVYGKQTYALKLIQVEMAQQARKQLCTELRTLSGALHPNIVVFHHAFTDKGCVSILMEYMDAGSLFDILKQKKRIPEHHITTIARQVLSGLQYLHKELRVVHRDVKPSNLLVNRRGAIKISDFGVSGQVANSMSKCATWVGTVTYMSPERISGKPYSFDSDFWSLGLTLFECAVGRFPYANAASGEDASSSDACESPPAPLGFWDLLDRIVTKPPPRLEDYGVGFSRALHDLVELTLQREPDARPSAADLLAHPFVTAVRDSDASMCVEFAGFVTGSV